MPTSESNQFSVHTPNDYEIVLRRLFQAPRALVYETMTQCQHLARWSETPGLTMEQCESDLRIGGRYRMVLRAPNDSQFEFSGVYREVAPPERLVRTFEFAGMPERNAVETWTLSEADGVTTFTMTSRYETKEARDAILAGMEYGAAVAYDRLAEYLPTLETEL